MFLCITATLSHICRQYLFILIISSFMILLFHFSIFRAEIEQKYQEIMQQTGILNLNGQVIY